MAHAKTVESDMLHIQNQLKAALRNHQILQLKLKVDCENDDVKKELNDLQRYIVTLGANQRRHMKILRMKNAIRAKSALDEKEKIRCTKKVVQNVNSYENEVFADQENISETIDPIQPIGKIISLDCLKKESEIEKLSIANSVYLKFGIPLEIGKLDDREVFMSCIELVPLPKAAEVNERVRLNKINHALIKPLMEIPKQDSSQRRRHETYLSCSPKKRARREPSSEKEDATVGNKEQMNSQELPYGPDQPFNEHRLSQESFDSAKDEPAEASNHSS